MTEPTEDEVAAEELEAHLRTVIAAFRACTCETCQQAAGQWQAWAIAFDNLRKKAQESRTS